MKVFRNVMILMLIVVLIVAISFVIFSYVTLNNDGIQSEELINHQYLSINEDYKLSIFQSSAIFKTMDSVITLDKIEYQENFIFMSKGEETYTFLVLETGIIYNLENNVYLYIWEIQA